MSSVMVKASSPLVGGGRPSFMPHAQPGSGTMVASVVFGAPAELPPEPELPAPAADDPPPPAMVPATPAPPEPPADDPPSLWPPAPLPPAGGAPPVETFPPVLTVPPIPLLPPAGAPPEAATPPVAVVPPTAEFPPALAPPLPCCVAGASSAAQPESARSRPKPPHRCQSSILRWRA